MSKAKWIWYPGDFELSLFNRCMTRRYERDVPVPPFWRLDDCYKSVKFIKKLELQEEMEVTLHVKGLYNVAINDGKSEVYLYNAGSRFKLPAGAYTLVLTVYNREGLPCILMDSSTLISDSSWQVTCNNGQFLEAASWIFDSPDYSPNEYRLETRPVAGGEGKAAGGGLLYDFRKEMMAYVRFEGITGAGRIRIFYGESEEEALDTVHCELCDVFDIPDGTGTFTTPIAKAFRYLNIVSDKLSYRGVTALYEYLPLNCRAKFKCNDPLLNDIWETSLYTLELNTREFFLDGIKRDRWSWSGDAYQSYLLDYYSFFETDAIKRTTLALYGKEPVTMHVNHIMDYSFYWIMGVYDYYTFTGDLEFVKMVYPRIKSLLEFCIGRTNGNGMMEGLPGDWVFVDWAPMPLDGEVSFEQILFVLSLEAAGKFGALLEDKAACSRYGALAAELKRKVNEVFWSPDKGCYLHSRRQGVTEELVTRYANMFAVLYDFCGEAEKESIKQNVLLNEDILKITTPYMNFYHLAALCEAGAGEYVLEQMRSYWGGMLKEGATSFWEAYDPEVRGPEKYAMYGRAYGKSLCHAWGAGPIYLLGRYFAGIKPGETGYASFEARPRLNGLEYFEATVPTGKGIVTVNLNQERIEIFSEAIPGKLYLEKEVKHSEELNITETEYGKAVLIEAGKRYLIEFQG